ncbi:dihydroxyacetone kinase subunit DhaL [Oceanobacillus chungangensis]|uniref:phosphoenolpyruvate--glycerone phosphotransferase n=1 Tax=Oceanobacillus chungangensis TaxID=1229152 RepID=A0A3D8PKD0_9BACI|nr:dihydroxyacetone kinase subunit DhaL [Oceanobacillus chungangensis]RDW15699.1 dihydroxyacetone kinase subunit L [Oceanobacillus chungangensis]
MEFRVEDAIHWFTVVNDKIQENKENLTTLDQVIGDSDHGINMARGFQEVVNKLSTQEYEEVADVLNHVAMTLISKVGGASGPLFGTAFLKFSQAVKGINPVDYDSFTKGLEEALQGVKQRGKAKLGEKTMIDVWSPVVDVFQSEKGFEDNLFIEVAREAMENTKHIMATKGRAAYFKEKSIGHIDPGSASTYMIFEALAEVIKGRK